MFLAGHPSQGCFRLQSHCAPCYFFNQASFYPSDFSFRAVDTRRYPRAKNRVWSDQDDHEERGSKNRAQALVDPTVTRSTIRADVGVAIVPQTISRHLAEANLKSKRPFRALPLTPEHRQLRLQWCQARSMWNVTDWKKVVFSDESRFVLGTHDNRVRVWRHPGERYNSTLFYVTLPA
ncbi:transposable element Tcb2 transposase [Trichonephila clavipes]|nr:transposable element Tcb2 transposase [Trichonephila clavipes]